MSRTKHSPVKRRIIPGRYLAKAVHKQTNGCSIEKPDRPGIAQSLLPKPDRLSPMGAHHR